MKLLILGGTKFLGKHLTAQALAAGHEVTLFNRGKTNPHLFPEVEKIHGERDGGLDALAGRTWDAAVDTAAYVPRLVRDAVKQLEDSIGHYTFVSSISVLKDFTRARQDETAPVGSLDDESVETVDGDTYGPLKALCERTAAAMLPGRAFICRPGLIVGPDDQSWRFTYWVERIARAGRTLAPGPPERPVQVIDVRDLAAWMLRMIQGGKTGVYHATGPAEPLDLGDTLRRGAEALGTQPEWVWVDDAFLLEHQVGPWVELPLWLPGEPWDGLSQVDCGKALSDGLTFRPLEDTYRDTLAWVRTLSPGVERTAGLASEKEATLLAAWGNAGL